MFAAKTQDLVVLDHENLSNSTRVGWLHRKTTPKAKNIKQKRRNYKNKNDEKHKTKVAKNTK